MQRDCTYIIDMTQHVDVNERRQAGRGQRGWVLKRESIGSEGRSLLGQAGPCRPSQSPYRGLGGFAPIH